MDIEEKYLVIFEGETIGRYYEFEGGSSHFELYRLAKEEAEALAEYGLSRSRSSKGHMRAFSRMMKDEFRVPGTRKRAWERGGLRLERVPKDEISFIVFDRRAEKGEPGYSDKAYSAPHSEGGGVIEGMNEWASWYRFNRKDDGTFEAELDEAWWWGGGHNDGGTIRTEVPEEWLSLPYEEFLERVVTLSSAAHYGFTAEELLAKEGLREFFGF
ncbi:MAG: hypothetical protein IKH31_00355 [Clostridia bacterium]|nr:hypothetical protein [Clostridia bacterium]